MADPLHKPRWLDLTVNVQTLLMASLAAAGGAIVMWYSLVGRVAALEQHDADQDGRATRIEVAMQQQRSDVNQQLRDISGDVKDIRNYLMSNAAGTRPDTRRWAK
ncbi:hypothetical protein ABLT15_28170 [Paraburkholderia tropica]|uniref:hypothetical protein n=1 Tax=Paraburkholderia tropica TaxID=92647 RepID=UPI0032B3F32B